MRISSDASGSRFLDVNTHHCVTVTHPERGVDRPCYPGASRNSYLGLLANRLPFTLPGEGEITMTNACDDGLAAFLSVRPRLFGIAYRMLGSAAEAEDILQDVWLRWQTTDRGGRP